MLTLCYSYYIFALVIRGVMKGLHWECKPFKLNIIVGNKTPLKIVYI